MWEVLQKLVPRASSALHTLSRSKFQPRSLQVERHSPAAPQLRTEEKIDLGREVFLPHHYRQNKGYTLDHKLKALFSDLLCWSHLWLTE